jgi:methanogenic corrinoid protein MtbC1
MSVVPHPAAGIEEVYALYWQGVCSADPRTALSALDRALTAGVPAELLVRSVVTRAQVDIGRLWETGRCSVADEHAATAVAEQAMALLRRPVPRLQSARRRIVLACAPGEWHSFPARLAGDLAERVGVEVVSLGASCPAEHLGVFLQQVRPDALALSVTMTVNLVGAWQAIRAAHLVGVPVVVGGAAWGAGHHRSERLGADMRVDDPSDLARAVNLVAGRRPLRAVASVPEEVRRLEQRHSTGGDGSDVESLLVRAAAVAVATEDPTVLAEMRTWLTRRTATDRLLVTSLDDAADRLAQSLADEAPLVASMLLAQS